MADITVNNFQSLKDALTDSTSTVIYLSDDIVFTSGGVTVPKTKGDITIDGQGHTISDYNSLSLLDTIQIASTTGAMTFTIRNTVWNGRNFYGVTFVPDSTLYGGDVTLLLEGVTYTGPQAVYNRFGITRLKDSTFNIQQNGAISVANELAEINRIIVEGTVAVTCQGTINSVLWFANSNTSLTVEENATLTVDAPGTYMFYSDLSNPTMLFKQNSATSISTRLGLWNYTTATYHSASTFTVQSNAKFQSTQSQRNGSVPSFKCRTNLTLEDQSYFHLQCTPQGTAPLMAFYQNETLNYNNPKSVILLNNNANIFSFTSATNSHNMNAELINWWNNVSATTPGDFDDTPTRAFAKQDGSNVSAEISNSTSAITSLSSNITIVDPGAPMNSTTFNIMSAKVLSLGNITITPNPVTDKSDSVTGVTEPNANLRFFYNSTMIESTSDSDGNFSIPLPTRLAVDTPITLAVNWNFLTKQIDYTVTGSISITHLEILEFKTFTSPPRKSIIKRKLTDWYVEITDTRTTQSPDWLLYCSLPLPLRTPTAELTDALIYNQDTVTPSWTLIHQGSWTPQSPTVTRISWEELQGFLLSVIPDFQYEGGKYISTMEWKIELAD